MKFDLSEIKEKINKLKTSSTEEIIASDSLIPASILIPLYEKNDITYLLFTKRTDKVRHHKGQICFPGGKFDFGDNDLKTTALRETYEEIGIKEQDITLLGKINNMVTITNFIVSPFVGSFPYPYNFIISQDEIEEIIEVPLYHFLDKKNFKEEAREINEIQYPIYYYYFNNHVIWGVTGKILFDFITILSN
jgi:8-oxo-dGTP pyrophosphatase MutT (NUDIX family)